MTRTEDGLTVLQLSPHYERRGYRLLNMTDGRPSEKLLKEANRYVNALIRVEKP